MTSFIDEWPTHLSLTRWRFFIRGPEARDKEYTTLVQIMTVNLLTRVQERRTPLYSLASFSVCCRHVQRMCYNLFIVLSIKSINFRYGNNVPVRIDESFNIKLKLTCLFMKCQCTHSDQDVLWFTDYEYPFGIFMTIWNYIILKYLFDVELKGRY